MTPVIAVENAGRPNARAVGADLGAIERVIAGAGFDGPVVVIIGEAVSGVAAEHAHRSPAALQKGRAGLFSPAPVVVSASDCLVVLTVIL
jgi:siroheme synthase